MLSIGEFSRVSRLTIKTLRYYHEIGLLLPDRIDDLTGYRFYGPKAGDRAAAIIRLKELGFSLTDIQDIFKQCREEADLDSFILDKIKEVEKQILRLSLLKTRLKQYRKLYEKGPELSNRVIEKVWGPGRAAGIRMKARYNEIGSGFHELFKTGGKWMTGKPFGLFFDNEYKETGADFMPCIGIRKDVSGRGIECFDLPERKAVACVHTGPYETLSQTYSVLFEYCRDRGYHVTLPNAEHYLKGPGMVFRGNSLLYQTEVILFVD